jgi:hypothetical protein
LLAQHQGNRVGSLNSQLYLLGGGRAASSVRTSRCLNRAPMSS